MNKEELSICERFKEIRKCLKMRQGDFASEIKTTQGHVSDIENKRKGVSDRVIEIICLKFNVNETWLRTGEGEMFVDVSIDEQISAWMGDIMADEPESFRRCFVQLLTGFEAEDWKMLERHLLYLQKIMERSHKDQD